MWHLSGQGPFPFRGLATPPSNCAQRKRKGEGATVADADSRRTPEKDKELGLALAGQVLLLVARVRAFPGSSGYVFFSSRATKVASVAQLPVLCFAGPYFVPFFELGLYSFRDVDLSQPPPLRSLVCFLGCSCLVAIPAA